ncbi:MAG: alpha/beta hydrolase family protein, partial [Actinomycetota bacterium]|nr:alpha/beta hydrolase family protein [Actinomycetota bacterium]
TDGVPPPMRYAANRLLLTRALDAARQAGDGAVAGRIAGWLTAGRQFLLVDLAGGRVAEVFGHLATATHVAVVVPGACNDLSTFDALAADAGNLQAQADILTPGSVATIAWLGYRTPGLLDAPFDDKALAATRRLPDLVAGLVLQAGVTTTVVAHSYGSMVAGRALRDGLRVDAVVALGSPGMTTSTAAGLHAAPGTRIYAARAPGDYVSLSENFGRDPSDPRFGATRFATHSPGEDGPVGHTGYFAGDSECTRNLARIVTGQYDNVTVIAPSPVEQAIGAVDALTSATRVTTAMALAEAEACAHLLPGPARAPSESAVEAARRLEHLNRRLADPDLIVDAVDAR